MADILHVEGKQPQPQENNAMKITNEQLRIMQDNELRKAQQQGKPSGEFGELLALQMEKGQAQESVSPLGSSPLSSQVIVPLSEEGAAASGGVSSSGDAASKMDGMFTSFERYAEQLAQGNTGNLREAYNLLQDVSGQIAGFKAEYPNAGEEMPEMAAMLNELDVLTTTETFKFNRGDYL